jgi:hypothetical protein
MRADIGIKKQAFPPVLAAVRSVCSPLRAARFTKSTITNK